MFGTPQPPACFQALDEARERELTLAVEHIDVRSHLFANEHEELLVRGSLGSSPLIPGVVPNQRTAGDDLHVGIDRSNRVNNPDHVASVAPRKSS
jgi:hypothetical protein